MPADVAEDPLNIVVVVPFDLAPATTSCSASVSSSTAAAASASSLAAAASNLISAIAQGAANHDASHDVQEDVVSDADSDEGSSSFTYTAPPETSAAVQADWYASSPYHISNRYYDVDITLKATKVALPTPSPRNDSADDALSQSFPAYLVVVDRSRSFEHHRLLAANLESKVTSGFVAEISIVAGVSLLSSSHPQAVTALDDDPCQSSPRRLNGQQDSTRPNTSDLVALYANFGWEFIAIGDMDEDEIERGLSVGSDKEDSYDGDDDADGIERIREALMNHMWNGLVRKDQATVPTNRAVASDAETYVAASGSLHRGFSDSTHMENENDDAAEDNPDGGPGRGLGSQITDEGSSTLSQQALPSLNTGLRQGFPTPNPDDHTQMSDLDEKLAGLFLDFSNGNGSVAELEAFLESEDPSWPALSSQQPSGDVKSAAAFDDDFDDFLPFQSAPPTSATHTTSQQSTYSSSVAESIEELPSMDEISQMRNRLFGANAAARLEAGPLGMASQTDSSDQDLASQLQQLQWHAERVRNIPDPDQRRKEAALIALAYSMQ
uniref:Uncharacterized protein n=1 Tax=Ustilago esculenta TaxID=185366 RepID=A0A481SFQ5_9BASI|nr:hypothetical protein UE_1367 [Ustilago esculenta]